MEATSGFDFGVGQKFGSVGSSVRTENMSKYSWTVIRPKDKVVKVYTEVPESGNPSSLIQYCSKDDIIISLDAVSLLANGGKGEFDVRFPDGATKMYLSGATGTQKIWKKL